MTRALIAEDEPLLAAALQQALAQAWPALQIVATVGDGPSAVRQALALRPEVLFFDIRMPGQSGLDAAAELADAARSVNPDVLCLCHGGPIANPEDAQYVLDNTEGIVGFYGASSVERFPTEQGIKQQTEKFKAITFRR